MQDHQIRYNLKDINNNKIIYLQHNYQDQLLIIITNKDLYQEINLLTNTIIQIHHMLKVMISHKINFKNKSLIKVEKLLIITIIIMLIIIKMKKITIIQV